MVKLIVSIVPGAVAETNKLELISLTHTPICERGLVTFEVDQVDDILARWLITEENLEMKSESVKWLSHSVNGY